MEVARMPQQPVERPEGQWTQKLQEQAINWRPARPDRLYRTDHGVPVVRRHKRSIAKRSVA